MIIRAITTFEQVLAVSDLEQSVWETTPIDMVPPHVLLTVAKNGGFLIGAYQDKKLIGYALGWLGTQESEKVNPAAENLKLVSHMVGVRKGYRDQNVGFQLKLAQREWALARKLELVTWTYDPLESRNANLNIRRLGATCQTYLRDYYGELTDKINAGLATDRFRVDWWIKHSHVIDRLERTRQPSLEILDAQLLNPARIGKNGFVQPVERSLDPAGSDFLIEIPTNIQTIRHTDIELAAAWRHHTRELFEKAFAAGYQITDFIFAKSARPQSFYLLSQPVTPILI
jgi:predicted GNAT superfamily acetyltransferase